MNYHLQALAPSALVGLVTLMVGLVWFYTLWQQYIVDQTRQRLFELRDQWFEACADAEILETQSAQFVREILNAQIRFNHRHTLPGLLWYLFVQRDRGAEQAFARVNSRMIGDLPKGLRSRATTLLRAASVQVALGLWRRSLLAILASVVFGVMAIALFIALAPAAAAKSWLSRGFANFLNSELVLTAANDPKVSSLVTSPC